MAEQSGYSVTITGIPLWLMREYLEELGARTQDDGRLLGKEWVAQLTQVDDYQIGSLRVGRVRLDLQGSVEALEQLRPALEKKLVRAGG